MVTDFESRIKGYISESLTIHYWEQKGLALRSLCGATETLPQYVTLTEEPVTCPVCTGGYPGGPLVYRLISRTELTDGDATLTFIIESNGRSWRLYFEHGGGKSSMAWYPNLDQAVKERDDKIDEAVASGWAPVPSGDQTRAAESNSGDETRGAESNPEGDLT